MRIGMNRSIAFGALLAPSLAFSHPPGAPMSEFGPSQISLACYYDHSGQDVFEDGYPSILNSTGFSVDYAPWTYVQVGVFGGAAEFDVALPESRLEEADAHSYNTDYKITGGGSLKLATPRFASGTTRAVAFGSAMYLNSEDDAGNSKKGNLYNAGATIQYLFRDRLNFVLGGEFYALDGEQMSGSGGYRAFGFSRPAGIVDFMRGIVGFEYFFKGANRPFVSVAFRPTGSIGWHDELGLRGGSVSISLGAMTTLGKGKADVEEEDSGMVDE